MAAGMPGRNDERHSKGRIVGEHAVRHLAVVAQTLAMIGGDGNDGATGLTRRVQPLQHAADLRIGKRDLAVVGNVPGSGQILRRRIVRRVRIVKMNPREERTRVGGRKPSERGVHDRVAAALGLEHRRPRRIAIDAIVVDVEPIGQAEAPVQHIRPHERTGPVAAVLQHPGNRRMPRRESAGSVHAYPILRRQLTGHDRRVRRQRQRDRRAGIGEA
jgi:hypothetical protein